MQKNMEIRNGWGFGISCVLHAASPLKSVQRKMIWKRMGWRVGFKDLGFGISGWVLGSAAKGEL